MKRFLIAPFVVGCLFVAGSVNAQSTPTTPASGVATPDTNQLKQYTGNYTVATGDIKQIVVTVERGKLMGEAIGLGQSGLVASTTERDTFIVPDPNGGADPYGFVRFGRDQAGKVKKVVLSVQGQLYEGLRAD